VRRGASLCMVAVGSAACLAACGGAGSSRAHAATGASLTGSLTVFAAASLATTFTAAEPELEAAHAGFTATYSFAGSQQLVRNIIDGAPADVIATADTATMQQLLTRGLVEPPQTFARNRLEIAVAKGNPKHIARLADLAHAGVTVVLADPSVPAGAYARQALLRAGVTVSPRSLELSVEAALEKVESGDADAAIVYATDIAAAGGLVARVAIPDADNVIATYPIAVVKGARNPAAARAFVALAVSGAIQAALRQRGFLPP
jgi:molybdate transport system substrate-binding protein